MKIVKEIEGIYEKMPVFGFREYMESMGGVIDFGYVVEGEKILSYVLKKRYIFRIVQIPCVAVGCNSIEEKKLFVTAAVRFLCKSVSPDVIQTLNTNICSVYPTGALYCKFGSYIIDLSQSEDELFEKMHSKHRNVVRKAIKDGLSVSYGNEYADDCFRIINDTYGRQGRKGGDKAYMDRYKSIKDAEYWVVKQGEDIQGCAILLWNKNFSSYYLHGGSISHPHGGALNLLHWEAIKEMKKRGVRYYDFVGARLNPDPGSKLEGIQRFKSRFGGELEVGYMWRYVNHPIRYSLYFILMKLYMKLIKGDDGFKDIIKEERGKGNY